MSESIVIAEMNDGKVSATTAELVGRIGLRFKSYFGDSMYVTICC